MSEPRNRVIQIRRFGGSEGLEVAEAELPDPGRGEIRVRVLASGIEYTDVTIRRHVYPWVRRRPPFVMGYDVVGEIDQLGDEVSGFQIGDRVADMTVIGSNATYRTLRADRVTRVPADVDAAEAAALILSWTTAYQLLHRAARVQRGQRVLVQGAVGAVGQALLALGTMAGLEVWGTARGMHAALVRDLGGRTPPAEHHAVVAKEARYSPSAPLYSPSSGGRRNGSLGAWHSNPNWGTPGRTSDVSAQWAEP